MLAAAQLKVDAALPPELRSRAVRMRERFHLDAPGWFAREEPVPHLAALSRAVWEEQRVEIRYRKRDGEVKRLLDPLGPRPEGGGLVPRGALGPHPLAADLPREPCPVA